MARAAICVLCTLLLCAAFGIWRAERKLTVVQRENASLSLQLELIQAEYTMAQREIQHQNDEIAKHATAVEQAQQAYQLRLQELAAEKALAEKAIKEELAKDSSAESQLRLITEVLQDLISSAKGGEDG